MAAVAGTVAVVVIQTSSQAQEKAAYVPELRSGQALVRLTDTGDPGQVASALRSTLPVRSVDVLQGLGDDRSACGVRDACTVVGVATTGAGQRGERVSGVLVGDATTLKALTGADDPKAVQTLADGGMVIFNSDLLTTGTVTLSIGRVGGSGAGVPTKVNESGGHGTVRAVVDQEQHDLPGYLLPYARSGVAGVVSPATASRLGLTPTPVGVLADTTRVPTTAEEKAARHALAVTGSTDELYVERGYRPASNLWMLILLGGAGVVTLGASGIVTGLTAADSRADLTTLAAIGAAPRTRRRLMAASAAIIAFLGSLLGVVAGFVPAIGLLRVRDGGSHAGTAVTLPWAQLSAIVLLIPLLAALFAWVFTRSRLPMPRRSG